MKIKLIIKIKSIILFGIILLIAGCANDKFFILSNPSDINKAENSINNNNKEISIGVETIEIPHYLFKRLVAIQKSNHEVNFLKTAVWAEDLDKGLTRRVKLFLQQTEFILKIQILRFIANKGFINLDASYEVTNKSNNQTMARLFSKKIEIKGEDSNQDNIVETMNQSFSLLEHAIAQLFNQSWNDNK